MRFGIVTTEHCFLREAPGNTPEHNESRIADELFSGWAVLVDEKTLQNGWMKAETSYAYSGYVSEKEIRIISETEMRERQSKDRFMRIDAMQADLLSIPIVQGLPGELLLRHAVVEVLEKQTEDGWSKVRTAAGREGYVRSAYLKERKDHDGYLLKCVEKPSVMQDTLWKKSFFEQVCDFSKEKEEELRRKLTASAMRYLGVQYRWGGKSSQGIDCSGLLFMSYMENGILIFRDARLHSDFPVQEISKEKLSEGDLIYFPGHVAMYLGAGRYIHATASAQCPGVGINSLIPGEEGYREDLLKKIVAYGSIFR